jgi:signal transduction histidine kinase
MLNRLLIRDRLNLLVLLPLSAVLVMTVPFVVDRVRDARKASTTAAVVTTARQLGGLIQELERERLLSVAYLTSPDTRRNPLVSQAETVDDETAGVRLAAQVESADLQRALAALANLDGLRGRVLRRAVSPNQVNTEYQNSIVSLIDAMGLSQDVAAGSAGARRQTALDALLRADEENSSVGAGLLAMVAQPGGAEATLTVIGSSVRLEQLEARRFAQLADPAQVSLFRTAETGLASRRVLELRNRLQRDPDLSALPPGERARLAGEIFGAVETEGGLRRLVQDKIARDIAAQAESNASRARLAGLGFAGLAIALLVAVVLLSVAIGRSIARPLRRLTLAAGQVADLAQSELIRVTDSEGDDREPVQLAAVDVPAEDEIGELAAALNRVQATAALLLERQVASRRNIASMFGSVGRRTQNLVGRQLAMIDALERNEQNTELLQRLYRLDHLSARLRRHADSLVVLSGAAEPMLVSTPLPVADVIRSALGEIEDFQRVRILGVAEAHVVPDVIRDLKLLVAELFENATSFSPPFSEVEVAAEATADGCQIVIVDHGVGMSGERLAEENARLISRERLDVTPSDVLGLFVVGRLCRRHGLRVTLEHTSGGGVTARITVPSALLAAPSGTGGPGTAPGTQGQPGDGPPTRPRREAVTRPGFPPDQRPGPQLSLAEGGQEPGAGPGAGSGTRRRGRTGGTAGANAGPGTRADTGAGTGAGTDTGTETGMARDTGTAPGGRATELPEPWRTHDAAQGPRALRQRVRGAQLPDTGEGPASGHRPPPQASPEAARDLVEQFEAGTLRALSEPPPAEGPEAGAAPGGRDPAAGAREQTGQGRAAKHARAEDGGRGGADATGAGRGPGRAPAAGEDPLHGGPVQGGHATPHRVNGSAARDPGRHRGTPENLRPGAGSPPDPTVRRALEAVPEPAPEPAPELGQEPDQEPVDPHAAAVRSFALEIDRELRRTLESLTDGGSAAPQNGSPNPGFRWLDAPPHRATGPVRTSGPANGSLPAGLIRRVPGAQLPVTGPVRQADQQGPVRHDADAARAAIEEFEDGVARAMEASVDDPAGGPGAAGGHGRTQEGADG